MKSNKFYFGAFVTFLAFCLFFFFFFGFGSTRAQSNKKDVKVQPVAAYQTDGERNYKASKKESAYATDEAKNEDYRYYATYTVAYKGHQKDSGMKYYDGSEYVDYDAEYYHESKDADYKYEYYGEADEDKKQYDYNDAAYASKDKTGLKYSISEV